MTIRLYHHLCIVCHIIHKVAKEVVQLPSGVSLYYVHPLRLVADETPLSVARRFRMTEDQLCRLNPYTLATIQDLTRNASTEGADPLRYP